jgi:tetratricopeptide (TPR) repeat protein
MCRAAILALALLAVASLVTMSVLPAHASAAPAGQEQAQSQEVTSAADERQDEKLDSLGDKVNETLKFEKLILSPLAFLVAVLSLGGLIGVVFSIRDQRRISQLHELTVGSEVASQRRTEQGYASFLEQSQTTLSLVNDTLGLAKEATDRAAHSMEIKAKAQIKAIEERAESLLLRVFGKRRFAAVVDDPVVRGELHAIADSLRLLEGYLSLQDIKLFPYTKFVKAIGQFLLDDTEAAIQALHRASQERLVGDLHRFTLYWLGYMYTTVGDYEIALRAFENDEIGLTDRSERFQLDCMIAETKFFNEAKDLRRESEADQVPNEPGPRKRFAKVAPQLDELGRLAATIKTDPERSSLVHVAQEVARTRADIFSWVAYDRARVDEPLELPDDAKSAAADLLPGSTDETLLAAYGGENDSGPAVEMASGLALGEAEDADGFRAWAWRNAIAVCEAYDDPTFPVAFAVAEAYFKVGDASEARAAFERADRKLGNESGEHQENRKKATLKEAALICHSRLRYLKSKNAEPDDETRHVTRAAHDAREVLDKLRQGRVTIFSELQRRNISQKDFRKEISLVVDQDPYSDEAGSK